MHYPEEMDDEEIEDLNPEEFNFVMEPQIEVIFSPQRINLIGEISQPEGEGKEFVNLEEMLERAIKNEEYELATKIRDLISQNKEKKLDK
jgi:excinuclease UvrABC helicase subunit UvrB